MSAWQKAIATAKVIGILTTASVGTESEAANYVKNVLRYQDRQRLEQQLRSDRETDAALWVSRNS